jgi:3-ketosteroid 9alpha-monooxygenase subunit A
MGGDLTMGKVDGDVVRCPYHDWGWGAEGMCLDIPYAKKIPKNARIKSWPTCEENQLLFIWNDPEGMPPGPDEIVPPEDACLADDWSDWVIEENIIHINCRELIDNMSDKAHFITVHGLKAPDLFKNIFEGHRLTQIMNAVNDVGSEFGEGGELRASATYYGPAYMIAAIDNEAGGFTHSSIQLVSHVPIDRNSFMLRHGVKVQNIPNVSEEENKAVVAEYTTMTQLSFKQDVDIWHNKFRVDNPLLCDGDGPLHKLREWYNQFYIDRDQVSKKLETRKEYTV